MHGYIGTPTVSVTLFFYWKSGEMVKFYRSPDSRCMAARLFCLLASCIHSENPLIFNMFHSGTLGLSISNHTSN